MLRPPPDSAITDAHESLIVALDLPSAEEASAMAARLEGVAHFFKVGLTLQLAPGVEKLIQNLIKGGNKVFLDYKYYDIPETLRIAVARASELGVAFLTIHGSSSIIKKAVEGRGASQLKLFTVTVLTSMDSNDLAELGYTKTSVEELVLFRAGKALEAGCDGVIASGFEVPKIKEMAKAHPSGNALLVVTPGIRPDGYPEDDQKRKVTPRQAIASGADYVVVGRPITASPNPREAAQRIVEEMQDALSSR
jgi:orotidine-5'-phosphate decarboxylase